MTRKSKKLLIILTELLKGFDRIVHALITHYFYHHQEIYLRGRTKYYFDDSPFN